MTTMTLEPTTIQTVQDARAAIDYVNAHLVVIANAALQQNEFATRVIGCYAMLSQRPNADNEERLLFAVEVWQIYRADNPGSEV